MGKIHGVRVKNFKGGRAQSRGPQGGGNFFFVIYFWAIFFGPSVGFFKGALIERGSRALPFSGGGQGMEGFPNTGVAVTVKGADLERSHGGVSLLLGGAGLFLRGAGFGFPHGRGKRENLGFSGKARRFLGRLLAGAPQQGRNAWFFL